MNIAARWSGHLWTIAPRVRGVLSRSRPAGDPVAVDIDDARIGPILVHGAFDPAADSTRTLALVVHGLGGDADSEYVTSFADRARAAGMATLRIHLRGADMRGEDYYHAGLWSDLDAVLRSPAARPFERVVIVGFSLGGHVTLAYATQATRDPRLVAVVSVCAPLDLDLGAMAFDAPSRWLYRTHILAALKQSYASVAARRTVVAPVARVRRIKTIREWDEITVAPRHGFASAADYYARVSVAPRLGDLAVPALMVYARHDPVVPWGTVAPALSRAAPSAQVVTVDHGGGHVGFAPRVDLGLGAIKGLDAQIVAWLTQVVTSGARLG